MSDTVKLIIEIPKGVVEYIKNNGCLAVGYLDEVAKAIKNGTLLDDVKAEIEHMACRQYEHRLMLDRQETLEIIDKYIGKTESEVHNADSD